MTVLAHGIGGIKDLPVPISLFFYGAGIALALSFLALAVLWRRPLLEAHADGRPLPERLQRVLLSRALRALLGAVSFALLVAVFAAAAVGEPSVGRNLAPTFIYVVFWLGVVPLVVLLGDVWSVLNPWRAAADAVAWVAARSGRLRPRPFEYPEWLGRWPAALLLFSWATLELAWSDPSSPRTLAVATALYSGITWLGMIAFGRRAWLENGEAFSIYFGLLSRIAPFAKRKGRLVARAPLAGLAPRDRVPGTIAFVAVMLGSVAFDGFSRTSWYQDRFYSIQSDLFAHPDLADAVGTLVGVAGLLVIVGAFAAVYLLAVVSARVLSEERRGFADAFAASLVPIALAYAVAHYFSLFVLQGQFAIPLASDPLGRGWDLFGTSRFQPDLALLSPNLIWYVQVGALVGGHVLGLTLAHDRAVSLFPARRTAIASQYPMLALMVAYTVAGLWLLSQG